MADFAKVLTDLRKGGYSDIHIFPGESCFVRKEGVLSCQKDTRFSEDEVKKIILTTSTPKAREILGKFKQVNFAYDDPSGERYRVSAYFAKGKFSLSIRVTPSSPMKYTDLGLPEPIKKIISRPSGLIIIGSPSGMGKTTTAAAIIEFINQHFEKNIITIENPVEIKFKDNRSSILQRGIPLDVPNFFEGLNEAYRLDPDVVMTDSITYKDALDQAFFLCEAGCLVIGVTDGEDSQKILEKIVYSRPKEEREAIKEKLVAHLNLLVCQKFCTRIDMKRGPVFDIVVNTPLVKNILKGDNFNMLRNLQEQDKEWGMASYEKALRTLVNKLLITPAAAAEFFVDNPEMAAKFLKK